VLALATTWACGFPVLSLSAFCPATLAATLFMLVISTIFLPGVVTLIPTYTFWVKLGLVGSYWPLILPSFFANAYDTFLLRQYMMTIPRELDEAAMIDGASHLQVLRHVIIPASWPAIIAITVFHMYA
jgi:multiple sugar transport system permease protein